MLPLKFVLDGLRPILARRYEAWRQREAADENDDPAQRHGGENASISVNTATTRT
jgi:hypothetical protein